MKKELLNDFIRTLEFMKEEKETKYTENNYFFPDLINKLGISKSKARFWCSIYYIHGWLNGINVYFASQKMVYKVIGKFSFTMLEDIKNIKENSVKIKEKILNNFFEKKKKEEGKKFKIEKNKKIILEKRNKKKYLRSLEALCTKV